jgi:hypothetical protein
MLEKTGSSAWPLYSKSGLSWRRYSLMTNAGNGSRSTAIPTQATVEGAADAFILKNGVWPGIRMKKAEDAE